MKNLFKKVLTAIVFVTLTITATAQKSYRITDGEVQSYQGGNQRLTFNQPVYFTVTQTAYLLTLADGSVLKFGEGDGSFKGRLVPTSSANSNGTQFSAKDSGNKAVKMNTEFNYSTSTWLINVVVSDPGCRTVTWIFYAK